MATSKQEIIQAAIQLERDGRQFYLDVAEKSSSALARQMFESLADDEVRHIQWIEKLSTGADSAEQGIPAQPFELEQERRFRLRCELDALFFRPYLRTKEQWEETGSPELVSYFTTRGDAVWCILDTLPIVKGKDEEENSILMKKVGGKWKIDLECMK